MKNKIISGDCLLELKELKDNSIDSIVTDPPYGLSFMGKKWDYEVPSVEVWKECLRVLKPGGHLLSFAGSRTYHRIAVNIEDAGFDIRDQIMWLYGSGFPKSLNIGKKLPEYEGWGTALKPAHEPIVVARKPLSEKTVALNVLKWGTAGINIDGCRVEFKNKEDEQESKGKNQHEKYPNSVVRNSAKSGIYHQDLRPPRDYTATGRFPANIIFDEEAGRMLDNQSGVLGSNSLAIRKTANTGGSGNVYTTTNDTIGKVVSIKGKGGASRFFYCAKASKSERNKGLEKNNHPTVKPIKLMRYLVRLVTPKGGLCLDPFIGSGTTAIACKLEGFDYLGIERESEYIEIAESRIEAYQLQEKLNG